MTEAKATSRSLETGAAGHLEFIDALRGWAFLAVLVVHVRELTQLPAALSGITSAAHFGVQLFFVVSALTLFMSFDSRIKRDRRPLAAFLLRRLFRIAPLFLLAIPSYVWLWGTAPREAAPLGIHLADIFRTALFIHGWFPSSINAVVPGGWSIAVEMNFYLLLPICYARLTSLRRALGALVIALPASLLVCAMARRGLAGAWSATVIGNFTYYWLPRQFPVFLLGFVLFFLIRRRASAVGGPGSGRPKPPTVPPEGVAALLVVAALFSKHIPLGYFLFSCGFVWLAFAMSQRASPLLVNRVTRYVGKVSFSAYITHFSVIELVGRIRGEASSVAQGPAAAVLKFGALYLLCGAGTLLLATVTYHLIEVPGQELGRALIQRIGAGASKPVGVAPGNAPDVVLDHPG
jgi:peptidoglycan/LPS O-acetylase OafA/YrhL